MRSGGFNWNAKSHMYSYHPLLMFIAFVWFTGEGMFQYFNSMFIFLLIYFFIFHYFIIPRLPLIFMIVELCMHEETHAFNSLVLFVPIKCTVVRFIQPGHGQLSNIKVWHAIPPFFTYSINIFSTSRLPVVPKSEENLPEMRTCGQLSYAFTVIFWYSVRFYFHTYTEDEVFFIMT